MNNKIKCNKREFEDIKNNKQSYKVFNSNTKLKYLDKCELINEENGEVLEIQITSSKIYKTLKDTLNIINIEQFGLYKNENELTAYLDKNYGSNKLLVCRIKKLQDKITINDKKILNLIKTDTLEQEKLGLSSCLVYRVKMKNDSEAILKIQNIKGNDNLKEEYDVLKYLKDKMNVANVYYYSLYEGTEYLLREYIDGEPLYKFNNFGYYLGKELKKIHINYSKECKFRKFETQNLLNNALEKIDTVYELRTEYFKDFSKKELIVFLKENKPEDDALIHGDFSLTNILVHKQKYYYIDLGNVSISTKYFDIYILRKSLKINSLEEEYEKFLKGYNINDLNDIYMRWMELIEISYN